jgi:hypothetical protein
MSPWFQSQLFLNGVREAAGPFFARISGNNRLNGVLTDEGGVFARVVYHVSLALTQLPRRLQLRAFGLTEQSSELNQLSNGGNRTNIA